MSHTVCVSFPRRLSAALALVCTVAPVAAQATDDDLRAAMLADLAAGGVLSSLPVPDTCPVCRGALREVKLRDYEGLRIDGPSGESARVCEQDSLWIWFAHHELRAGTVIPHGFASGPAALRPGKCDRTLGPLPWDALSMAAAPSPAPNGASIDAATIDGRLVVGGAHDSSLRVWAGNGQEELLVDEGEWGITGLALSPRGDALAFARNGGPVQVVAVPSGKKLLSVKAPSEFVARFAFDPGLHLLAMGCQRGPGPDAFAVEVLDLRSKRRTPVVAFGPVMTTALAFADDGERLAIGDFDGNVRIWSKATQKTVAVTSFGSAIGGLRFSPDGRLLAVAVGSAREVHLLAAADGAAIARVALPESVETPGVPYASLAFSNDGSRLALGGRDGLHWCKVSKPDDPRRFFPVAEHDRPWFDGHALVTVGHGRRIVWDLGRAQPVR